jgi:preprotein translocase subunit Sec61beta
LLLALLEERFQERIDASARVAAEQVSGSRAAERLVEEIPFDRRWNLLFLEFVIRAARDKKFARQLCKRLERLRANSAAGIERFLEQEDIRVDLTPEQLALFVAALGNGFAVEGLLKPSTSTDPTYAAALTLMLEGARAGSSVPGGTSHNKR